MIKILFLVGLLKILDITQKPFLCAGIYGFLSFLITLIFGYPFIQSLVIGAVSLVLGALYFWLLDEYGDEPMRYWFIAIFGLPIGLV